MRQGARVIGDKSLTKTTLKITLKLLSLLKVYRNSAGQVFDEMIQA